MRADKTAVTDAALERLATIRGENLKLVEALERFAGLAAVSAVFESVATRPD